MSGPDLSSGIIAAPIIPFETNGAISWTALEEYIAQVAAGSPRAIAMNMALSEVSSLSLDEQVEVVRRCKNVIGGQCVFLSGINATYTVQAMEIARRVVDAGADGVVLFPPVPAFLGPLTPGMIAEYHQTIAEAVNVPLVAFQTNFVSYPAGTIKALSEIPSIVGIKDASFDVDQTLQNVKESREAKRKIGVFTGSDTFILEAILMGCDGALIGFAATATAALVQMHEFASSGKVTEAYEIWNDLAPLARIGWRQPMRDYRVRMKYTLMKQGIVSNCVVRAPMPPLADVDRSDIDRAFADRGLDSPKYHPAGRRIRSGGLRAAG
jgi:4-hydroxy-tetrahydrodipicolinate synthase